MSYKIIASDLDGTLLSSDSTVSKENFEAIKKLGELGVIFMPSSGRTLTEIPEFLRANEYIRYISYADGAAVLDKKTGETLAACMEPPLMHFVLDMLDEYDTLLTVRNGGNSYVDACKNTVADHEKYRMTKLYNDFIYDFSVPKSNYSEFCRALPDIEMICVFFSDDRELAECRRRIEAHPELICAPCEKYNLEIFHRAAGKGNALLRLADHLGIDHADTIAVGDSPNDVTMIKAAGLGLAMGNAWDELVEVAAEKICDNDHHVAKYILENYIESN